MGVKFTLNDSTVYKGILTSQLYILCFSEGHLWKHAYFVLDRYLNTFRFSLFISNLMASLYYSWLLQYVYKECEGTIPWADQERENRLPIKKNFVAGTKCLYTNGDRRRSGGRHVL